MTRFVSSKKYFRWKDVKSGRNLGQCARSVSGQAGVGKMDLSNSTGNFVLVNFSQTGMHK